MLAIRVCGIHGDESVFEALHVITSRKGGSDNIESVECFNDKYEPIAILGDNLITHGTVYVMNSNGKTVAVYYLKQE